MNLYEETKFIMKKYNLFANKSLGQNFLIDEDVVNNIVKSSDVSKEDLVIEIGPGLGTLTKVLLENAKKVICIELDKRMIEILENRFKLYDNFKIINDDVLKVDLNNLIKENKSVDIKHVKIVANLPYYITTPIIMKLLEEKLNIDSITVMIQKEVASRLCTIPGKKDTGSITYGVYYYSEPKIMFDVPNTSFIPEPEVTSTVIKLDILKEPRIRVKDEKFLFKLIKVSFMQKRKTLLNALVNGHIFENKESAEKCFNELKIDLKIRAENLSLEEYGDLSDYLKS